MDIYRHKIEEEIGVIPDYKLKDLFEIIQSFRLSVFDKKSEPTQLLGDKFAGTWLGDEKAEELIDLIKKDRVNRLQEIKL